MANPNVTLRPFRNYDEKDVVNLFAFSGTIPANKGTFVTLAGNGFYAGQENLEMLGDIGFNPGNVVSQRYGVVPKVQVAGSGDKPLGILLFDVKETDENGYQLKFAPRKADEMEVALSGQAVPIVTRGVFQYSGALGTITAGADAYIGSNGYLSATGTNKVGKFLGQTGYDGSVVVLINCL